MKFEPLSVVVLTIFSQISYDESVPFIAPANTLNEGMNTLKLFGCRTNRTPPKTVWMHPVHCNTSQTLSSSFVLQQSNVVSMYSVFITASLTFSFTVVLALLILSYTVVWDMIVPFGCGSWTRLWNAGCSTSTKGWQPWTKELNTALSTHFWDSCFASWSFICLRLCGRCASLWLSLAVDWLTSMLPAKDARYKFMLVLSCWSE